MASAKTPKPKAPTLTVVPDKLERHYHKLVLPSTLLVFLTGSLSALLASNGLKSKTKQGDTNETK